MIVAGLRKPGKDETNNKDSKSVISAIVSEARLDEEEFTMHMDKDHLVGGTKRWQTIKNCQIHHPQF